MTKDDALKLALEVMHNQGDVGVDEWIATEAAINQALAAPVQPEQEPVACLSKTQAKAILDLALDLEKTGRMVVLTEGQERTDFAARNRNIQCALEDALRNATTPPAAPMTEFEEAVAAVDNTLHHAIDYWQNRALKAEALLAQPEQEPVAWEVGPNLVMRTDMRERLDYKGPWVDMGRAIPDRWVPVLYTTPPAAQRQWVGLTNKDIIEMWPQTSTVGWDDIRLIEAKLKEKNT